MFDKKKLNFWRLSLGFGGLVLIALMFLWSGPQEPKAQMMTGSMGNMMADMHGKNITIYDFFVDVAPEEHSSGQADNHESHHEDAPSAMRTANFLTTAIIFLLLPVILGGSIALAIVWFR
jgi:hypothetical protein